LLAIRRKWFLTGIAVVLALTGAGCAASNRGADPVGTLVDVRGTVELISDGDTVQAAPGVQLFAGDELRAGDDGSASFELGGDGAYELVRGSARIVRPDVVRLDDATLVLTSDTPAQADFEVVQVAFNRGTVRVELSPGRIAAYEVEELKVTAGEREGPLPALWQVSVTADGTLDHARPLQFSRDDPIDAVHLAHAIDVDSKLGNLLRGVEPQLAATDGSGLSSRLASAGIPPQTLGPFAETPRSDLLMGLAFAREWRSEELAKSFEQAMALKALGASWGLIAQAFGVNGDALVASLQNEIDAVLFPGGTGAAGRLVPPPLSGPGAGSPGSQPSRRPAPAAPAVPAPAPAAPPGTTTPTPSPTPGLLGPVVDPLRPLLPNELETIIDELYGLVNGLVPLL